LPPEFVDVSVYKCVCCWCLILSFIMGQSSQKEMLCVFFERLQLKKTECPC
jgi:hypothetical protein